jgi:putative ABC transport system permease protein
MRRPAVAVLLREFVAHAAEGALCHRLRAALATLGVVVGIATIVTAMSVAEGGRRRALAEIGAMGLDNVFVRAVPQRDSRGAARAPVLRDRDARALTGLPGVDLVATSRTARSTVAFDARAIDATVAGVSAAWPIVAGLRAAEGRMIGARDVDRRTRVAVLGAAAALRLGNPPLGSRLRIGGDWFTIVGILPPHGDREAPVSAAQRVHAQDAIFVPIRTLDWRLGAGDAPDVVEEIVVRARSGTATEAVANATVALMRRLHPEAGEWEIVVPRELLDARLRARATFDRLLFAIGALALGVSAIGIMNIMLAAVAERTVEIGVRRAVGATRAAIVAHFTAEAALICVAGAAAGIPFGVMVAAAVAAASGLPVAVSFGTLAVAIGMALAVGVASGVYPARLAARVDPAEALRA